jgi:hypothetical protein
LEKSRHVIPENIEETTDVEETKVKGKSKKKTNQKC